MAVHRPPAGARDLLPTDVAQKVWIERRVRHVFEGWGYHRIITATLERLDTLLAGGAVDGETVMQVADEEGDRLGLRPELTASIARAAVTRLELDSGPERLFYNANVFRRYVNSPHGQQHEFYQAGVELLGAGGLLADAEILLLLADSVRSLGLDRPWLLLGEANLTRSLLDPFPPDLRSRVRRALANLDRVALEALDLSPALRDRALFAFDLRGRPQDVLSKLGSLDLDGKAKSALDNLKSLIDLLEDCSDRDFAAQTIVDLSSIQTFDYYTGIVFKLVSATESGLEIIGRGGRYDNLLELYHPQKKSYPGIGFVLDIEALHQVLLPTGKLPPRQPPSHWLVVPKSDRAYTAAFAYANKLRQSTHIVRVELADNDPENGDRLRDTARHRGIVQIAWVDTDGTVKIERLRS